MARLQDRRKAIKLRLAGYTYPYIKKKLNVGKGTLTPWLRNIKLTREQLNKIKSDAIAKRVEKYIITTKERQRKRFEVFYENEKKILLPINKRELFIAGLFLYLGEGAKSNWHLIQISNTDPSIMRFSMFWLTEILGIPKIKIKSQIHLYKEMDVEKELIFWSKITGLPKKQFIKPYIKNGNSQKIDHPSFGHGTCSIYCSRAELKYKIMASMKVILESVNGRIV